MVLASDLNAPSSWEWHWMTLPALSVQSSPMVHSARSVRAQPSSNTRRPSLTPSSRQIRFLNGVPLNACRYSSAGTFQ